MKYQIMNDEDVLREDFRKAIIEEINGAENVSRKQAQAATWEIWRDQVRKFVLERLQAQGFKKDTLAVMVQRASNVNLFKKIISKKARSYSKGVERYVPDNEQATADIEKIANSMKLTKSMKRADAYRKAARNAMLYIYPEETTDPDDVSKTVWGLCTKVFYPHLYDVVPDAKDREKMRCLILSPFAEESSTAVQPALGTGDGRNISNYASPVWQRDYKEQNIANSPRDTGSQKKEYIFWTAKYHLTCDEHGKIVTGKTPPDYKNPIGRIPAVNICQDQDGEFWAQGGEDLFEATILLNLKLTDMESILHMQGWGQFVIEGQDIKKVDYALGPQQALILNTDKGADYKTEAKILQHDPHTKEHLDSVEVHVALCLTTNNLSIKTVATSMETSTVASAIAKMVDESDNLDDISEDQEYFGEVEKDALRIGDAWAETIRPLPNCAKEIKETKKLNIAEMVSKFHNQEQVVTEAERLDNLKKRKELGIDSEVDLIKKDNPGMTEKQAIAKVLQMRNEKLETELKAKGESKAPDSEEKPPVEAESEDDSEDDSED